MKNKTKRQRDEGETKGNIYGKRQSLEVSEVSVAMGPVDAA
jgi:ribosomal protein L25 (general stress protein Ctc)